MLDSPQEEVTSPVTPQEFGDVLEKSAPKLEPKSDAPKSDALKSDASDEEGKVNENPYESSQNEP